MAKDDLLKQVEDLSRMDLQSAVTAAANPLQEASRIAERATKLAKQLERLHSAKLNDIRHDQLKEEDLEQQISRWDAYASEAATNKDDKRSREASSNKQRAEEDLSLYRQHMEGELKSAEELAGAIGRLRTVMHQATLHNRQMAKEAKERPGTVTAVCVLSWIGAIVFGIVGVSLMFGGSAISNISKIDESVAALIGGAVVVIGILLLLAAVFSVWITYKLWQMKNWARIVFIILHAISLAMGVVTLPGSVGTGLVSIAIDCLYIYLLAMHTPTVRTFKLRKALKRSA